MSSFVDVTRGEAIESRHTVHIVVAHADRGSVAISGDAHLRTFVRSAIKMFQALPLVEDRVVDSLQMSGEELSLCAASHNGEPLHVATAREILAKARVDQDALACGPHLPMSSRAAAALVERAEQPTRLHNNCSGKHAGMLALCQHHGWPTAGYHTIDHPVQQRVQSILSTWSEVPPQEFAIAIDGCGLPTFALPLDRVALACARFAAAAAEGQPAAAIHQAMTRHPEFVAGSDRLCTRLMQTAQGRLFAKVGAEGYYCAGVPEQQLGIALKVQDGSRRAAEPMLLAVLRAFDALTDADLTALESFAQPAITNTRGEHVGTVRALLQLTK